MKTKNPVKVVKISACLQVYLLNAIHLTSFLFYEATGLYFKLTTVRQRHLSCVSRYRVLEFGLSKSLCHLSVSFLAFLVVSSPLCSSVYSTEIQYLSIWSEKNIFFYLLVSKTIPSLLVSVCDQANASSLAFLLLFFTLFISLLAFQPRDPRAVSESKRLHY